MLELKNIYYRVDNNQLDILKNINITIDERFVAITGPNGGGKSTLAKIIAGIVTPTAGQILLDGEDITNCSIIDDTLNFDIIVSYKQDDYFYTLESYLWLVILEVDKLET